MGNAGSSKVEAGLGSPRPPPPPPPPRVSPPGRSPSYCACLAADHLQALLQRENLSDGGDGDGGHLVGAGLASLRNPLARVSLQHRGEYELLSARAACQPAKPLLQRRTCCTALPTCSSAVYSFSMRSIRCSIHSSPSVRRPLRLLARLACGERVCSLPCEPSQVMAVGNKQPGIQTATATARHALPGCTPPATPRHPRQGRIPQQGPGRRGSATMGKAGSDLAPGRAGRRSDGARARPAGCRTAVPAAHAACRPTCT